mmetsp:Transcript_85551/g.218131  ORF Transcript_85551/g.218131 Transcript_85551/m.218131 type:complete len:237 (-) Transcript_85551:156-866(-)
MKVFGRDITERFCKSENLALIVRSHQFKNPCKGYEIMHDGWLVRVFSARNYNGRVPNDGGILLIGRAEDSPETLLVRPQVIERLHRQATAKELSSMLSNEPYCPVGHLMQLERPKTTSCLSDLLNRREEENHECARCGAEELRKDCFFHCSGCGLKTEQSYNLCLACADLLVQGHTSAVSDDDSQPGDFSEEVVYLWPDLPVDAHAAVAGNLLPPAAVAEADGSTKTSVGAVATRS